MLILSLSSSLSVSVNNGPATVGARTLWSLSANDCVMGMTSVNPADYVMRQNTSEDHL